MKKILQFITGGLIKDIGQIIDDLVTTDEERLAAKQKVEELLEQADKDAQDQVTARWEYKANGSYIPYLYIFCVSVF
jgi:hypothetical protein